MVAALGMLQNQICRTYYKAHVLTKCQPAFGGPQDCWKDTNNSPSQLPGEHLGFSRKKPNQTRGRMPGSNLRCASWRPLVQIGEELGRIALLMGWQKCSASLLCV